MREREHIRIALSHRVLVGNGFKSLHRQRPKNPGQTALQFNRGTDIAGDGRRFVGIRQVETEEADRVEVGIHVVLNWFAELERLAPTGK